MSLEYSWNIQVCDWLTVFRTSRSDAERCWCRRSFTCLRYPPRVRKVRTPPAWIKKLDCFIAFRTQQLILDFAGPKATSDVASTRPVGATLLGRYLTGTIHPIISMKILTIWQGDSHRCISRPCDHDPTSRECLRARILPSRNVYHYLATTGQRRPRRCDQESQGMEGGRGRTGPRQ